MRDILTTWVCLSVLVWTSRSVHAKPVYRRDQVTPTPTVLNSGGNSVSTVETDSVNTDQTLAVSTNYRWGEWISLTSGESPTAPGYYGTPPPSATGTESEVDPISGLDIDAFATPKPGRPSPDVASTVVVTITDSNSKDADPSASVKAPWDQDLIALEVGDDDQDTSSKQQNSAPAPPPPPSLPPLPSHPAPAATPLEAAAAPPPPALPSVPAREQSAGSDGTVPQEWVDLHNAARKKYGAGDVMWDEGLAKVAQQHAALCNKKHTKAGENLEWGDGSPSPEGAVDAWMAEAPQYDYGHPGYTEATGHFSQVVWKDTTRVGCYIAKCPAGTVSNDAGFQIACEYDPAGNYVNAGEFAKNVGRPV
ncbi:hypothetical protein IAR55_007091 [Kwoniella newhampshirensis]|uniref:SCP domain-containing protein n=1 Tax=Kwoniella newhampshirensis TaxID=1651941 RepID=A0AAW0YTB8_9TREE